MRKELINLIEMVGLKGKEFFQGAGNDRGFFSRLSQDEALQVEMMLNLMKFLMPKGLRCQCFWFYHENPEGVQLDWDLAGVAEGEEPKQIGQVRDP